MDRFLRTLRLAAWTCGLIAGQAAAQPQALNHSFAVDLMGASVCLNGAEFVGEPTQADALNLLMTGQVFDAAGTTLLASGNAHTFTAIGEKFTFVVLYPSGTFSPGDTAGLSVSDIPGSIGGVEGFFDTAPVADCELSIVPATSQWGLVALMVLLAASGVALTRRSRAPAS